MPTRVHLDSGGGTGTHGLGEDNLGGQCCIKLSTDQVLTGHVNPPIGASKSRLAQHQ